MNICLIIKFLNQLFMFDFTSDVGSFFKSCFFLVIFGLIHIKKLILVFILLHVF